LVRGAGTIAGPAGDRRCTARAPHRASHLGGGGVSRSLGLLTRTSLEAHGSRLDAATGR
jgi:hypothetical protein